MADDRNDKPRKIIHIDMDCFFAAVEVRENPHLSGEPVAVGGRPDSRGVVAACNYEARKYGVHSAMPVSRAIRCCPNLHIQPVNMALYKQVSGSIRQIFSEYTDLIEPLSLDEAYLDVTDTPLCNGSATRMARQIRQIILATQGLTASAGIAPNKFLAKVASDWNKPDGQKVIAPHQVGDFVAQLPVNRIAGVGKVTTKKMHALGLQTCRDLQALSIDELTNHFGKFGQRLYQFCRGIDPRPVMPLRTRKSLSVEDTFARDLPDLVTCLIELNNLYAEFCRRYDNVLQNDELLVKNLFVKIRFDNFSTTTIQSSARYPDLAMFRRLCADAWHREQRPVRLIGVGVQFHPPGHLEQLDFFFRNSTPV